MSGLASVLAGNTTGTVHQWHANFEVADVAHTVEQAGWHFAHVDGWKASSKSEVLAAFAETLSFPDWFGHNFDALHDCLYAVSEDTLLLWDGWGTFAREDERAFAIMLDVLTEPTRGKGRFVVLLRGAGPDLPPEISSLD